MKLVRMRGKVYDLDDPDDDLRPDTENVYSVQALIAHIGEILETEPEHSTKIRLVR